MNNTDKAVTDLGKAPSESENTDKNRLDAKLDQLFASVQCACGAGKAERRYLDCYELVIEAKESCFEALDILEGIMSAQRNDP